MGMELPHLSMGTVATAVVGLVIGMPTETPIGPLPGSSFNADVPKPAVGNPQPGNLFGAVNGRTFTADTSQTQNLERSTILVDHTFVKAQRDNGHPAATYVMAGNGARGAPSPTPTPNPQHQSLSQIRRTLRQCFDSASQFLR
jgi:hypothetical protein